MIQIAIFSDVHGNLPALKTILNDIKTRNIDQVYCLGDLVDFAPWTNETIQLIRELHIPCLMGNHDERIAFDLPVIPLKKHSEQETQVRIIAINYTKATINASNKNFLADLPFKMQLTFGLENPLNVLLVHASARSNDEYLYEDHDLSDLQDMMAIEKAGILVMGHTHESYIRKIPATDSNHDFESLVINCGSVGRLKEGKPLASYLILTIENGKANAELVKINYPVNETIEAIRRSGIPDFYADFLIA